MNQLLGLWFALVNDRYAILTERRGVQHALHAVSALLGHHISATTLRWYTHLLDLSMMHYVSRSAAQAALPRTQISLLTGRGKVAAPQMRDSPVPTAKGYRRPILSAIPLDGPPPELWQVVSGRGRATKRIERALRGPTSLNLRPKPRPVSQVKQRDPGTDWRHIVSALRDVPGTDDHNQWRRAADELFDLPMKSGRLRHDRAMLNVSRSRKWLELIDRHWSMQPTLTALERRALFYAVTHWDTARCGARFRSRPLALAWRDLLRRHSFSNTHIRLAVTGNFAFRSSAQLHEVLATADDLPGTAAKRGARGTIMISFDSDPDYTRHFKEVIHFLVVLMAIREGFVAGTSLAA